MESDPMRRKEKEISSRDQLDEIMHACQVCHLGMALDNQPYVVPVNYGYDGDRIYFHTALKGKKTDILAVNPRVCFQLERDTALVARAPEPCNWSFSFESIIGFGRVRELIGLEEKKNGLVQIIQHYGGQTSPIPDKRIAAVRVWCIQIEQMTGKRSKP